MYKVSVHIYIIVSIMETVTILKTEIAVTDVEKVCEDLINKSNLSVAICNANTLVRCYRDEKLKDILNSFDINCPDGFPVAKSSSILYKNYQKRVDGYNIFLNTIRKGLQKNTSHYFFGNEDEVTKKMIKEIKIMFPQANILGYKCPPIKNANELASEEFLEDMLKLNPDIVWVSLGFPKQEIFIDILKNKNILKSNFVGIGAVFAWVAGTRYKAPEVVANMGFEWLLRLFQEPKRLAKRYFVDNFLYIIYFMKQYFIK